MTNQAPRSEFAVEHTAASGWAPLYNPVHQQIVHPMNSQTSPRSAAVRNAAPFQRKETRQETVFRLAAASARNVLLAADFTGWKKSPLKMSKGPDGVWHLRIRLEPGRYRYQFLIDLGSQSPAAMRSAPSFGTLHGEVDVRV